MKIGFTGTQRGMYTAQLHTLREFVYENADDIEEFHHGVCVGADTQAHLLLYDILSRTLSREELDKLFHYHPPTNTDKMSDLRSFRGTWHRSKPYLERNHDIVDAVDLLIAGPSEDEEVLRSGTWATIRYARQTGTEVKQLRRLGGWL